MGGRGQYYTCLSQLDLVVTINYLVQTCPKFEPNGSEACVKNLWLMVSPMLLPSIVLTKSNLILQLPH